MTWVTEQYPQIAEWVHTVYTDLHREPELSMQEEQTARRLESELTDLGLDPIRVGGTGVVAVLENGDGPVVLARADIDALPVTEATDLPYASTVDGVMHACGHDAHAAALLGAVRLLNSNTDQWSGTYVAVFQPGEELAAGASAMVDDGLFDKVPHPEVALGQHVMALPAGTVHIAEGPMLSIATSIKITLHGRSAHGSMPDIAIDPVVVAAAVVLRLQTIVARELAPGTFGVLSVGSIHAGNSANTIPETVELQLNLRCYDDAVREQMITALERIVRGECDAAGMTTEPEFEYFSRYPLTANDPEATQRVRAALAADLGEDAVVDGEPMTASEDFTNLPRALDIPSVYWFVGGIDAEQYQRAVDADRVIEDIPVNHSATFAPVPDATLPVAVRAHVAAALGYLA